MPYVLGISVALMVFAFAAVYGYTMLSLPEQPRLTEHNGVVK